MNNDINERQSLIEFTEKAYLNYSMYVILDRALPNLADGLKPVQRRIIYAMSELGLKNTAKYKKSARTIGDVLGKFHPHGDSACYEAMVLMAQPFSYRYPFVDGQGNWGSPDDPKSFAAMRYTEARLSPYAELLLGELEQGTVDWVDNFDGTLKEPALLPARLPNVLLNGAMGIAVGMSTDILPHNLREVASACLHLIDHPAADLKTICSFIQGPDFPSAAEIITPPEVIHAIYATGHGSIKMRAIYQQEKGNIVITALPYQVSGAKIIEQLAAQMQQKKLPWIDDLRDESDHEHPTRLVIIPKSSRVEVEGLMSHLFATTDLERSYRLNFNVIGLDGKPGVKNLLSLLNEWLTYRIQTVKKRTNHRLNQILQRIHILEGLMIAYLNIDEVIAVIREEESPKQELMKRFNLSAEQADAVLDMKLRHLAKLEEVSIRGELDVLHTERSHLQSLLDNETLLKKQIKKEIDADRKRFGDARKSPLMQREESQALPEENLISNEFITVILSQKGWIRAAKGLNIKGQELSYKAGDQFKTQIVARNNQQIVFFDTEGKVYSLFGYQLPSARGQGEPLTGKLNPAEGAAFETLISGDPDDWVVIVTSAGYGFTTQLKTLYVKNKNGKACIKLTEHANVLSPKIIAAKEEQWFVCATKGGRLLAFPTSELPELARGKGNKLINISGSKVSQHEEFVSAIQVLFPEDTLIVHAGKRHLTLKKDDLSYYYGKRAARGNMLPRGLQQVSHLEVISIKNEQSDAI